MTARYNLYLVSADYCNYLRCFEPKVPINSCQKSSRPFIGIVLKVNQFDYFAPLTSPKPKHQRMREQIDFIKIDNGRLGAVNLNNMLPVMPKNLLPVDIAGMDESTLPGKQYKVLLQNQLTWCNREINKVKISKNAQIIHSIITKHPDRSPLLSARCCNFLLLEDKCRLYHRYNA